MYHYLLLAAGMLADAQEPWNKPWTVQQDIAAHEQVQGVIMMPVGRIHIVIAQSGSTPGIIPSDTCVAMTLDKVPVGGQIARKDGRCDISFLVETQPTPYIVGMRNDDYTDHTYLFSYSK